MGQGGGLEIGVDVFDERVTPVGLVRGDRVVVLPDIYGIVPPPELIAAAN